MKTTDKTLICKSTPEYYSLEKSDRKANTIRIETAEEIQKIRTKFFNKSITTIRVINTETNQYFERQVTDISRVGNIAGHSIIVISWKPKIEDWIDKQANEDKSFHSQEGEGVKK